ncbi:MAG TPA: GAF domain-containing protein [Aggregatilineaceae bacterium]|nr:GAF domain-containing protein [Aggregatilineaceae bacterium]
MNIRAIDSGLQSLLQRAADAIHDLGWNLVVVVLRDDKAQVTYPAAAASTQPALKTLFLNMEPHPLTALPWRQDRYRISRSYFVDHRMGPLENAERIGVYHFDLGPRGEDEWHSEDLLLIPVAYDGVEFGWVTVDDPVDRQRPTLAAVRALEVFADQAALTIYQFRLAQQAQTQVLRLTVLSEISQAINQALDMEDLLTAIVEQLRQAFKFRRASITLREGERPHARISIRDERWGEMVRNDGVSPLEDLAFEQIVRQGQPYRIVSNLSGALADEKKLLADGIRSYVCLPLAMWGRCFGALSLAAEHAHAFQPNDADFLLQLAGHIGGAVWNALLYEVEQRRRHLADALVRLSKRINSTLDLDEVLDLALQQLARVVDYDSAAIMLVEGMNLHITAARGFENNEQVIGSVFRWEENNIAHQTMQAREARVVGDVQLLPEWGHDRDDVEGAHTIHAWVGSPLLVRNLSIGILTVNKNERDFFTDEDGETVGAFASQIATAIYNARLYESEQRRRQTAAALAELAHIVNSTLELDDVLRLALGQLANVVPYDTATIFLVDGPNLVIAACAGFSQPERLLGNVIAPDRANVGYQTLLTKRTRVISDVTTDPEWGDFQDDLIEMQAIRSWIGAPLIVRGQAIGIVTIDKAEPAFYTDEDGDTATAIGAQIATAIANARLFAATQTQRDRLTAILRDTSDAIVVVNLSNQIWMINPAAERNLKVRSDKVVGQTVRALGSLELVETLADVQRSGQAKMSEIQGAEGVAFNASIAPVRDVGWVIVMQDITPLKELDRLRTEWVAAVSHDLKNPIQVVQLGAALIEMDGPLNDLQQDRIRIIQRSAVLLSNLVAGVLDLARLEAGPPVRLAPVNPAEVCSAVMAEMEQVAANRGQQLVCEIADDLPVLRGDLVLLTRAISNLTSNALKYTPNGGVITLQTRVVDDQIEFAVRDNGAGIPEESLPHLFDRFYRVPGTQAEGSGLGLSIVKSIVDKHNGHVLVSSTLGVGSTFKVRVPV